MSLAMKRPIETVMLDSDSENEPAQRSPRKSVKASSAPAQEARSKLSEKSDSLAGGSRNDMERERVARQQAREAVGTAQPKATPKVPSSPKIATLSSLPSIATSSTSSSAPNNHSNARRGLGSRYWEYRILKVSNEYVADSESLSFDDVLGPKEQLESALVGAFVLKVDWVLKQLPENVPVLLLKAKSPSKKKEAKVGRPDNEVWEGVEQDLSHRRHQTTRIAPRTEDTYGCFHSKIIILTYKSFIRLCIPTANATNGDWSKLDNMLYIQDFPRITSPALLKRSLAQTAFSTSLLGVLRKLSVPQRLLDTILTCFNFSKASEIQLVVSNQGMHFSWDRMEAGGGLLSLAAAVKACSFSNGGIWEIEATGSSIGNLSDHDHENWLSNMYSACTGVSAKSFFAGSQKTQPGLNSGTRLPIKIVFPTHGEVEASHGGLGPGSIFFPKKYWKASFPKHLMYRGGCKRDRVISHAKSIVAIHRPGPDPEPGYTPEGWFYTGSHNFTPAAWGELSGGPSLTVKNYELGVLIPIKGNTLADIERKVDELVSYVRPLVPYSTSDVPFFQELYKEQ